MSTSPIETLRQACLAPPEQPGEAWLRATGRQVMDLILDDHLHLPTARVGQTGTRAELERLLREPPPEVGIELDQLLADFHTKVLGNAYRTNHPRFFAFIPAAPSFASILGECLASGANLFAGVWKEAAGATQVEIVVLDWFKQLLGYPAEAAGILTSGGSEASLTALVVAREAIPHADRSKLVLYASEQRHWSIDRAAKIIGLAPEQIRPLACDADFRLRMDALRDAVADDRRAGRLPWLVVASAGTTNTGSVDPLAELADFASEQSLWLHVDAAYGWPMVLTDEGRRLFDGIDRADSITLDPHKWFAQPFEAGGLLVRHGELLGQTFKIRPEYMQDVEPRADEINFCDHGIALTRRFRALKIWFSIKLLGLGWFRRLIEHGCALAEYAQALVEQAGCFEITSPRNLGIICFRFMPRRQLANEELDALQQAIAEELFRSGKAFLSTTRLHGQSTLRLCFVNWRTTAADVEDVVRSLAEIGGRLEKG
ncbi:MAG: aminotransferase class V-fold PLP-dependent enzyme [Gemmataceae bacterium]|nr:aminotransferase class V-fold PLP-dependent enzyme [Gemmataceae bacterium]